jgi:hypothetical protein
MVANVATAAKGPQVESIWDSEDEQLLGAAVASSSEIVDETRCQP